MTKNMKGLESSVTNDIIRKVHLSLADLKTGTDVLNFLKSTEPVFMEEVNRFIRMEISRMRYQLTESQTMYFGSIIGSAYIAGFLIAREAAHQMFDGQFNFVSDVKEALTPAEIEKIIDQNIDKGVRYKEIAKTIEKMLQKDIKPVVKQVITPIKKPKGSRIDLGELL